MAYVLTQYFFIGVGPTFLDNGSQPFLIGSPQNLHTSLVWGQTLRPTLGFFYPTPKKFGGGNQQISLTRRNGSTYWQTKDISFTCYKCTKNVTKLGASSHGVLMQSREKIDKL